MVTYRVWNYGYGPYGTMVTAFSWYGTMVTANLTVTILPCLKIDCHHKAVLRIGCHHSSMKNPKCQMSPHVHSIMVTAMETEVAPMEQTKQQTEMQIEQGQETQPSTKNKRTIEQTQNNQGKKRHAFNPGPTGENVDHNLIDQIMSVPMRGALPHERGSAHSSENVTQEGQSPHEMGAVNEYLPEDRPTVVMSPFGEPADVPLRYQTASVGASGEVSPQFGTESGFGGQLGEGN